MSRIQDPRIHLMVLLSAGFFAIAIRSDRQLHLLLLLSLLYLLLNGKWRQSIFCALGYAAAFNLLAVLPSGVGTVLMIVYLTLRMLPVLMIGTLLVSSPPGTVLWSGSRMRLPRQVLIMLCVLFRFSSVIRIEMAAVRQGIRARGILPHWYSVLLHPAKAYECFVLPLIIRGLKLSTELTCAAQFRGVESRAARSCIYPVGIRLPGLLLVGIHILGGCMILRLGGGSL